MYVEFPGLLLYKEQRMINQVLDHGLYIPVGIDKSYSKTLTHYVNAVHIFHFPSWKRKRRSFLWIMLFRGYKTFIFDIPYIHRWLTVFDGRLAEKSKMYFNLTLTGFDLFRPGTIGPMSGVKSLFFPFLDSSLCPPRLKKLNFLFNLRETLSFAILCKIFRCIMSTSSE